MGVEELSPHQCESTGLLKRVLVALVLLIVQGCSVTTTRFDLPALEGGTPVVRIHSGSDPTLLRPHTAVEGFFGGAAAGGWVDCLLWLCVPVLATAGSITGLGTAESHTTVEQSKGTLESSEIKERLYDLLIGGALKAGRELTSFQFVAADQAGESGSIDGQTVELIIEAVSVGIRHASIDPISGRSGTASDGYVFSLIVQASVGRQRSPPIEHKSPENDLEYWIGENGVGNLRSSLSESVSDVSEKLVRMIFLPDMEPDND